MTRRFCPEIAGSTLAFRQVIGGEPVRTAGATRWEQQLQELARQGFKAVDIVDSWLPLGDLDEGELKSLGGALGNVGLVPVGLSVIRRSVIDPEQGPQNLDYTQRALLAASQLGAAVVSIGFHAPLNAAQKDHPFWSVPGPEGGRDPRTRDLAVARVAELAGRARELGLAVALELYEDTWLGSGKDAVQLVNDVGASNLGINADLANLYRQPRELPETWQTTLEMCLPHMNYWHVKNFVRSYISAVDQWISFATPLEDGDIDYRLALDMAARAGYQGPICVEHYGGDGMRQQEKALSYLKSLLEAK